MRVKIEGKGSKRFHITVVIHNTVAIKHTDSYASSMSAEEKILYEDDNFQVVDMVYAGRPARILFTGNRIAAQSGIAKDGKPELLFDYNQRFLEVAESIQPRNILLIGGGAYTWPMTALRNFPNVCIDVVEPEASLKSIATRFFGLRDDARLRIFHQDGSAFLEACPSIYDLIIIDAFSGITVPESLTTEQSITNMQKCLHGKGSVAMNIVSPYWGRGGERLHDCYDIFCSIFDKAAIYPADSKYSLWQSQNFVLVACHGSVALPILRFAAIPRL